MTRIIHCPEFHYSLANAENTLYAMNEVAKNARSFIEAGDKVYVISSGDLHDRSLQATERQGFPALIDAIANIASSCTKFIMMYGTRSSHDIEGSYKAYEFIPNVIVLDRSENTFFDTRVAVFSFEEPMPSEYCNIPVLEYTGSLSAKAAKFFLNAGSALKIIIAHGTVLCEETANDASTKFGTVHFTEEQFIDTGANMVLIGHLHHGFRLHNILGGYAHSLAHIYSDDGFVPDFIVYGIDAEANLKSTERVTLKLPARFNVKVKATRSSIDINDSSKKKIESLISSGSSVKIKPRIEIEKLANTTIVRTTIIEELKNMFPGAFIDYPEITEIRESAARNVDIKSAQSYRAQAKMVYPDWTEKDFEAMDWLEQEDQKDGTIPSDKIITLKWVEVTGYKPFKNGLGKDFIRIDFSKYGNSVVGIVAPGGSGKSSTSDLVYPHPECLSQPAMKTDLFGLPESSIRQGFDVNGDTVICEIKGNAETGKFVYLCSVNGEEKCKKGIKEYKELVNSIFGTIHEYALTVVRTQFRFPRVIDGVAANPDIKYSTNKELKDVYNSLIGNDKTATQKRCKAKADEIKAKSTELSSKLSGIKSSIESISADEVDELSVASAIEAESERMSIANKNIEETISSIATISANVEKRAEVEKRYKAARLDLIDAEEKIDVNSVNTKIVFLEEESKKVDGYKAEIASIQDIETRNEETAKKNSANLAEYTTLFSAWSEKRNAVMKDRERITTEANAEKSVLESARTAKHRREAEIAQIEQWLSLVKSCPKCGFVDPATESLRSEKTTSLYSLKLAIVEDDKVIAELESNIDGFKKEYLMCVFTEIQPEKKPEIAMLPCGNRQAIQDKIDAAQAGLVKIAELRAKVEAGQKEVTRLKVEVISLKDALDLIPDVSEERNALLLKKSDLEHMRSLCQKSLDDLRSKLAKAEQNRETLKKLRADAALCEFDINAAENGYNDWSRYQKAWGKDGIPARFIEIEAPIVDSIANEMLAQFYPQLYIESKTSRIGADGKVLDDFDIKIYNTQEGTEQSLFSISGEQSNFVLSALYFAFRQAYERNKRVKINVCVEDEPDSNVGVDKQGMFCDMVRYQQSIERRQRLYISHSSEVQSILENVIYLQEL